jgi:hypothetical protein
MVPEEHSLRQFFHQIVFDTYSSRLGMRDNEVTSYVADLLTEFCEADNMYRVKDANGRAVKEVGEMLKASDPVHGTASSFDEEREVRKHIGDFTLFYTGMYPESTHRLRRTEGESFVDLVKTGKESYYIVSQFNVFEYAVEAPLFAKLSETFERCLYGLTLVREEMLKHNPASMPQRPPEQRLLM